MDPRRGTSRGRGRGSYTQSVGTPTRIDLDRNIQEQYGEEDSLSEIAHSSQIQRTSFGFGRGRGRGLPYSKDYVVDDETPVSVPLRPREDPVPDDDDDSDDDDFISAFRKLHPTPMGNKNVASTSGSGLIKRGIGRGRGSLDSEILENYPVEPTAVLKVSTSPVSPSATSSSSKTSSEDFFEIEKAVIVMRGKHGELVHLCTNFVRLNIIDKNIGLHEYHVYFDPMIESKRLRYSLMKNSVAHIGQAFNFDGAKLYLPKRLSEKITTYTVSHPHESNVTIRVDIKYVKQNSLDSCVHFYNVLLRRIMLRLGKVEMNRNFFDYEKIFDSPIHKLQIWPGFVTAIDVYEGGLMLCCDSSFKVLRTDTMFDALCRYQAIDPSTYQEKFQNYALGKIVLTKYNNKNYRVDDVDWDRTPRSTFPLTRGGVEIEISFVDYYKTNYGISIRNLDQPMLVSRGKVKKQQQANDFSPPVNILLVPELCYATGMTEDITSDYKTMKVIADQTRISPAARHHALMEYINSVNETPEVKKIFSDWGLELDIDTVNLQGRLIQPPVIILNRNYNFKPTPGDFSREVTRHYIYDPIHVSSFLVVCTSYDDSKARRLLQTYRQVAPPLGIAYNGEGTVIHVARRASPEDFRQALERNIRPQVTQFVVVIIPSARDDLYRVVKLICNKEIPMPSQVILSKTLNDEKKLRSVMQKVVLQINCKLGGALWAIGIPLPEKIMFIGMDVYHDPKQKNRSVTGFVATLNHEHTNYISKVIFQNTQQETISSLKTPILEALTSFYEENKTFPDRVVVFRDGVGDGQLDLTRQHEVLQMTDIFDDLNIQPKFTFCVVQKRINARLFEKTGDYLVNPNPGTIMDNTITRRYLFDFFLVSQLIRQGTVNPTHYIVLFDNAQVKPDIMQKFAYATSYMYYNWPGSIRVPAVCQYAHKLAGLVGQHLRMEPSRELIKKLYYL